MPPSPRPHSGLQKQVLALFRSLLREARRKDLPPGRIGSNQHTSVHLAEQPTQGNVTMFPELLSDHSTTTSYASREFRRQALGVRSSDFKKIEYMIRKGEKQLKLLRMPGVRHVEGTTAR